MFQLETESLRTFYEGQRATLNDAQKEILDKHVKSVKSCRNIEMQLLEWQNQKYFEAVEKLTELKIIVTEEASDIKRQCETIEKRIEELRQYQNELNKQIDELMLLKQPVQFETTYVVPNVSKPKRQHNIIVSSGSTTPKLSYKSFVNLLQSCESSRVQSLIKLENDNMESGRRALHESIQQIINELDDSNLDLETKKKIETAENLIHNINDYDIFSYMTVVEQLKLIQRIELSEQEKNYEIQNLNCKTKVIVENLNELKANLEADLGSVKNRYAHDLEKTSSELNQRKKTLNSRLKKLLEQQAQLSSRPSSRHALRMAATGLENSFRASVSNIRAATPIPAPSKTARAVKSIASLEESLKMAKARYASLDRRHRLEIEGYDAEMAMLQKELLRLKKTCELGERLRGQHR